MRIVAAIRDTIGRLADRKIPLCLISLSAALLGALLISVAVMAYDLSENQKRIERANTRFHMFDVAASAHRHFGEMRFWLTDLSVSLLTLAERRADAARALLDADVERISAFAPEAADMIRSGSKAYYDKAMQAADAYTDGNRVIGNTYLAAARQFSDEIDGVLNDLGQRLGAEADQARDTAAAEAQRTYMRALIAVALITIAGALMTWWVLRSILVPLSGIDRAMVQLTEGESDVDLPPEGRDEFGRLAKTLRLLRDSQNERRRLEVAAERQRNTIVTAIETIPDGFAFYDPDDRLVMVNQRYLEIFPETAHLMTPGRPFEEVVRAQAEFGLTDAELRKCGRLAERCHRPPS